MDQPFEVFVERVLADPSMQDDLLRCESRSDFVARAVELALERDIAIDEHAVDDAFDRARHAWRTRWV